MTDINAQNLRARGRSDIPWPGHINAKEMKTKSNFFVGNDTTLLYKGFLSIRTMVGAGLLIAYFLPKSVTAILAAVMMLPQLFLSMARYFHLVSDPLRAAHPVRRGRYHSVVDGDFCVFLIGAVHNKGLPSQKFKEVGDAFNDMVRQLESDPEKYGFMGAQNYVSANQHVDSIMSVQFWRTQEQLNAYARDGLLLHFPNMKWLSKTGQETDQFGFWHESYRVRSGEYETIYVNCPELLLGRVGKLVRATGNYKTARGRLGATDGTDLDHHNLPMD